MQVPDIKTNDQEQESRPSTTATTTTATPCSGDCGCSGHPNVDSIDPSIRSHSSHRWRTPVITVQVMIIGLLVGVLWFQGEMDHVWSTIEKYLIHPFA